ncbi:MAG: alpha/beta family hydrolase [Dehalococcoidia bacterium]
MTIPILVDGVAGAPRLALAHGAGGAMDTAWMQRVAAGLAARGLQVVRFEFPYMAARREGRRPGPDREHVLLQAWRDLVAQLGDPGSLCIGGKSMGGRMASMVADELAVAGLVCLGYPFHPPGRPERTRTAHLAELRTPALIVQGARDPFGTPDDVAGYALSPSITVHWVEDGDHDLKPRAASGRTHSQNLDQAMDAAAQFVQGRGG